MKIETNSNPKCNSSV